MKTELHDVHVSRELALLLKKAGFDWKCRGFFDDTGFHDGSVECTNYYSDTCKYLKASTLEVAQRWLREIKKYWVTVSYYDDGWNPDGFPFYEWKIESPFMSAMFISGHSQTYEEAQEAGIKKALEIIL